MSPVRVNRPAAGSYSSADRWISSCSWRPTCPPVTSTRPSRSSVAVSPSRRRAIDPVAENLLVRGSYSSAEARNPNLGPVPPTSSTRPSRSRTASWSARCAPIRPAGANRPVAGSYSSAVSSTAPPAPKPPATRTRPSGSSVALWPSRGVVILGPSVNRAVAGEYRSVLASAASSPTPNPPATSIVPSRSSVAVCTARGAVIPAIVRTDPTATPAAVGACAGCPGPRPTARPSLAVHAPSTSSAATMPLNDLDRVIPAVRRGPRAVPWRPASRWRRSPLELAAGWRGRVGAAGAGRRSRGGRQRAAGCAVARRGLQQRRGVPALADQLERRAERRGGPGDRLGLHQLLQLLAGDLVLLQQPLGEGPDRRLVDLQQLDRLALAGDQQLADGLAVVGVAEDGAEHVLAQLGVALLQRGAVDDAEGVAPLDDGGDLDLVVQLQDVGEHGVAGLVEGGHLA